MNAPSRFAVKACLLAAVSGALFNQAIGLVAQDEVPSARDDSAAPRIRRTAAVQGGTSATSQSNTSQGTSEVQKKLQELYRKNGREMPSMNMEDLPNTAAPVPTASAPVQVAPNGPIVSPNQPSAKPGKPNWFERTFHFGRGKRQSPAVAQPVRPGPAVTGAPQPQRFSVRPAPLATAPMYRAPVATPAPAQQPAVTQQPLREPSPIGIPNGVSDLAARPAAPDAQASRRNGISPDLIDDSESDDDSETLDLNRDEQPKFVHQAPQIRPNPTFNPTLNKVPGQTSSRDSDSPYTGLTISPNEMEQKTAASQKSAAQSGSAAARSTTSEPAALAPVDEDETKIARSAPATVTPKADMGMDEDDDEDDEDDDEPLTLPLNDAGKPARKNPEVGRVAESDKPAEPAADKPASEKPLADQPASEKPAADKPATDVEKPVTPAPMKCFRGYCPVVLKDDRKLIEAKADIKVEYRGRIYTFSSIEAKETFEDNPRKYIPAGDGIDVVRHAAGDSDIEGTLEHAAWYRGRLYLFSSAESRREFVDAPSKFGLND
jgi:YHS domain-containing protein